MATLHRRIMAWIRCARVSADLLDELEFHRLLVQQRFERAGMSPGEAANASRRALGNVTLAREDARAIWIGPWLESLWQDVAYALRTFRRQPGLFCVAIGALAAAIGLNTSLFSVFNALALRQWPARDPQQIVSIFNMSDRDLRSRAGGGPWGFSLSEVAYFTAHARTFEGFVVTRVGGGDKTIGEDDVPASWVSGNYFSLLGIEMANGRGLLPEEDLVRSPAAVAVLSYGYWQRHFGGDSTVIGRQIRLEDVPFIIVGVAARSFTGTLAEPVDIWMPLSSAVLLRPDDRWVRNVAQKPDNCCSAVAGRLKNGVTRQQAAAELMVLDRQYRQQSEADGGITIQGTQLTAGPKNSFVSGFGPMLAGAMLVLLIACANVANLLLARAAARRREIGVRVSIGASRSRIIRQLLTESLVLATASGAAGLTIALWLPAALIRWSGANPGALQLSPDRMVLAFTIALSVLASLVFGLVPAFHGAHSGVAGALKDLPTPRRVGPLRNILLAVQVAIAVILLVSAAVIANSVRLISLKDLGFAPRDLAVVTLEAPARGYDAGRTRAVSQQLSDAFSGDSTVALTSTAPLGSGNIKGAFRLPGDNEEHYNAVYEVSSGYFGLLHVPVIAGRTLTNADVDRHVIVINESMASKYWGGASAALGRHIVSDPQSGGFNHPGDQEIVGVVRDVYMTSLTEVDNTIYQSLSGRVFPQVLIGDTTAARDVATRIVSTIDPRLRVRVSRLAGNVFPRVKPSLTAALLAGLMGALALALASIGIFAVFAYWVQQRTREIGIRMALGARPIQVVGHVLRSGAMAIAAGAVCGVAGAAVGSRALQGFVFGLSTVDLVAYGAVVLVVAAAGALATYWPARRATRVDPVIALRCD